MDGLSLLARHVAALEDPPKPARSAQALPNSLAPLDPCAALPHFQGHSHLHHLEIERVGDLSI